MIKRMETDNIKIGLIADQHHDAVSYDVVLTIKGEDNKLSIDELQEIIRVGQNFWEVNNLYQHTSEAIAERKRWEEEERNPMMTPTGVLQGRSLSKVGRF